METILPNARKTMRLIGPTNLAGLFLIGAALGSLIYGLGDVLIASELRPLLAISLAGALIGSALAGTKIPGWLTALLTWIIGALIILLGIARLGKPLSAVVHASLGWFYQIFRLISASPERQTDLSMANLQAAWQGYLQAGQTLWERLSGWVQALLTGRPVYDPLGTQIVWAGLVWFVSVWAAWWVFRRRQPLLGLAPAGLLLAASLAYSGSSAFALIVWVGALVALQALTSYKQHSQSWSARRVDVADLEADWIMAVIPIVAGIMIAAWFLPSLTVPGITERFNQAQNLTEQSDQTVADAFGIKRRPQTSSTPLELSHIPGLPNKHLIGSGPELSKQVVMWVTLTGTSPDPAAPAYYWRALTYDRYASWGWYSYPTETTSQPGGGSIPTQFQELESAPLEMVHQDVRLLRKGGGLAYNAGELQQLSQDYQSAWHSPMDLFGAELGANHYTAVSQRSRPSPDQLRLAGDDYPQAIREAYLPLPKSLPQRVWDLALDLTVTEPSAYDRALAIQAYLRQFPYTLEVKAPPPGRDLVDYFLFDLKRGYCDYYASAMVALARAAGLPARLVVGYASGSYDPQYTRYTVTAADAHAWAEIYFPGYGWVEFEPTSNRSLITPRAAENPVPAPVPPADSQPVVSIARFPEGLLPGLLIALVSGLLLLIGWEIGDRLRLERMSPQQAIIVIYTRFYRLGQRLQPTAPASLTPHEFAARLIQNLANRSTPPDQSLPDEYPPDEYPQTIHRLVDLYTRVIFSHRSATQDDQLAALRNWYNLRGKLRRTRLNHLFRNLKRWLRK